MDSQAPRQLSSDVVITTLEKNPNIIIPLIPELWKYSEDNFEGVIKWPKSIVLTETGQLLVLDSATKRVYSVRLHSPAQVKQLYQLESSKSLAYTF